MENIKKIEEMKATLEALAEARKEYSGRTALRAALRQALSNKNTQASAKLFDTDTRSFRKTVKAAITNNARVGDVRNMTRLLSISQFDDVVQDYLPLQIVPSAGGINATYWRHVTYGQANIVNESATKPVNNVILTSQVVGLQKMAIQESVSLEALMSVGTETLLDALEALLVIRIEDAIHREIVTRMLTNAEPFDATPYSQSVFAANYIDTLYLTMQQERRWQLYESPRVMSDVDLIVMPVNYYERLGVLKDAMGRRLFNTYQDAFGEQTNTLRYDPIAQQVNLAVVARSSEIKLALLDEVYVAYVLSSPNANMGTIVVDVFFNMVATPRVENNTANTWYTRRCNLLTDTQAINIP